MGQKVRREYTPPQKAEAVGIVAATSQSIDKWLEIWGLLRVASVGGTGEQWWVEIPGFTNP